MTTLKSDTKKDWRGYRRKGERAAPQFKHDCPDCAYLGSGHPARVDFYFCRVDDLVTVRFGDGKDDRVLAEASAVSPDAKGGDLYQLLLSEARQRAVDRGLYAAVARPGRIETLAAFVGVSEVASEPFFMSWTCPFCHRDQPGVPLRRPLPALARLGCVHCKRYSDQEVAVPNEKSAWLAVLAARSRGWTREQLALIVRRVCGERLRQKDLKKLTFVLETDERITIFLETGRAPKLGQDG